MYGQGLLEGTTDNSEVDCAWIDIDTHRFRRRGHRAYDACHQAVQERLSHERLDDGFQKPVFRSHSVGSNTDRALAVSDRNSPQSQQRRHAGTTTQNQLRAIFSQARRQRIDLQNLASERFGVNRIEDLSIREASTLIDELKRNAPALRA